MRNELSTLPKFASKIISSVSKLLQKSTAKSLQYECLSTIILAFRFSSVAEVHTSEKVDEKDVHVNLVLQFLREFVGSDDQNLKCLGLLLLQELMLSYPSVVTKEQIVIANCLLDADEVIRTHAVKLIALMVQEDNLVTVSEFFMKNVRETKGSYRDTLIMSVLDITSAEKYCRITDFSWYLNILLELAKVNVS
jgi:AP-3 complex subunit delta-1